ncbi:MAG: hypothetical protein DMG14_07775 [Acidobacteria bacterium]|nr:MAG: hypothetical protein DMG14_07775 [Acidobacteriota bacterium]
MIDKTSRDVKNRTYGTVVTLKSGHSMGRTFALFNSNWPPAIRLMVGTTGSVMTAAGIAKGGTAGTFLDWLNDPCHYQLQLSGSH